MHRPAFPIKPHVIAGLVAVCWGAPSGATSVNLRVAGPGGYVNTPLVTLEVCVPGGACYTVPDVLIDTTKVGLELRASALPADSHFPQLRPKGSANAVLGVCQNPGFFESAWGGLRSGVVRLAGVATSRPIPFMLASDPDAGTAPTWCNPFGGSDLDLDDGINGILGIAPRRVDCGADCADPLKPLQPHYAIVTSELALPTAVPVSKQLTNPLFDLSNSGTNSYSLRFDAVAPLGAPWADGALTFGETGGVDDLRAHGHTVVPFMPDGSLGATIVGTGDQVRVHVNSASRVSKVPLASLPQCGPETCPTPKDFCPHLPSEVRLEFAWDGRAVDLDVPIVRQCSLSKYRKGAQPKASTYIEGTEGVLGMPALFGRTVYFGWPDGLEYSNGWIGD